MVLCEGQCRIRLELHTYKKRLSFLFFFIFFTAPKFTACTQKPATVEIHADGKFISVYNYVNDHFEVKQLPKVKFSFFNLF